MGDVGLHFDRDEFRCKGEHCCGHAGPVSDRLVAALDELHILLEEDQKSEAVYINVTSGFRCPVHNAEVKGDTQSYHMLGEAADIQVPGVSLLKVAALARKVRDFASGCVLVEPTWIHVDVRRRPPLPGKRR